MIDFHAHLDLYSDPHAVAKECHARGMYVLSVTTTPSAWEGTTMLAEPGSRIRTALGLHPQLAHQRKNELDLFDKHLPNTPYIGEIGLDGAPDFKRHWEDQLAVFDHILNSCTRAGGRIMTIHSRRASAAVLDRLEAFPNAGVPILHWFTGSRRELERAVSLGCWFSIGPAMLEAASSRKLIDGMPRDRILTETDGPFAKISGRQAMPWDVQIATAKLGELWSLPCGEVDNVLHKNLRRLVTRQSKGLEARDVTD